MRLNHILICLLILPLIILQPIASPKQMSSLTDASNDETLKGYDGVHLDFLVTSEVIGLGVNIWNYGTQPAFLVYYEITTKGLDNATVIGGNKKGVIPVVHPKDTVFIRPLRFPKVIMIHPFGLGLVEVTVRVYCKNANYDNTVTTYWFLRRFTISPFYHM
jgi:hypothetical protein